MRDLSIFVIFIIFTSCVPESSVKLATDRSLASDQSDNGDDHQDNGYGDSESIAVIATTSSTSLSTKLSESLIVPVQIKALDSYSGSQVSLALDSSSVSSNYIDINLDQSSLAIEKGETKTVNITITTETMAESFSGKNLKLTVSDNNSGKKSIELTLDLEVKPEVEIKILAVGSPYIYSIPNKNNICFGKHFLPIKKDSQGVQLPPEALPVTVTVKNMTSEVNADRTFCLHTSGRFGHCNTGADQLTTVGQVYTPRSGNASVDVALFYNHEDSSNDNNSRRLHFKVDRGDESSECPD